MYVPHGIYPDDSGALLSASVKVPKAITLLAMDTRKNSFLIRVTDEAVSDPVDKART